MKPYDKFLLFGDSITQQANTQIGGAFVFQAALQDAYIRRLDVVNRGFSGYNSAQALRMLPDVITPPEQGRIRLMTIFFGANDACLPGSETGQHVAAGLFQENLKNIITHPAVQAHNPRIILITPPPIDEYALGEWDDSKGYSRTSRLAAHTQCYASLTRKVAQELNLDIIDLWGVFMDSLGWRSGEPLIGAKPVERIAALGELLHDGLHLTSKGYEMLFQSLMSKIRAGCPDLLPENISEVFPPYEEAPV